MSRFIDETGNRYERLLVLERVENDKNRRARWLCHCDCGNEKIVSGKALRSGNTRSCGCLQRELSSERSTIDLTGQRYGRLTVIEKVNSRRRQYATWLCKCDCGNEIIVLGHNLRSGNTKSCGCWRKEHARKLNILPEGVAAFNALISAMKRGAKNRGLRWGLTDKQVASLTKRPCYYCGARPSQVSSPTPDTGAYIYNGLDRVDNDEGYVEENVVPCCKMCNYAKQTMTVGEFKAWATKLYRHFVMGGEQDG